VQEIAKDPDLDVWEHLSRHHFHDFSSTLAAVNELKTVGLLLLLDAYRKFVKGVIARKARGRRPFLTPLPGAWRCAASGKTEVGAKPSREQEPQSPT
jgi:hypothetical protein